MLKKITSVLTLTAITALFALSPVFANTAYAGGGNSGGSGGGGGGGASSSAKSAACEGVALTGGSCDNGSNGSSAKQINSVIATVINLFSLVVGVTAVIMIMVGGFKYITSTGDSSSINSAKNTILYAIIGLVIVALAQVIVRFVLTKV